MGEEHEMIWVGEVVKMRLKVKRAEVPGSNWAGKNGRIRKGV